MRLPTRWLGPEAFSSLAADTIAARESGSDTISTFEVTELEDEEFQEERLASFVEIRDELSRGDLRSLYLGWLMAVQSGEIEEDASEPPVPPGLGSLTRAQERLASFFGLAPDLIFAAAEISPSRRADTAPREEMTRWLSQITTEEKDDRRPTIRTTGDLLENFRHRREERKTLEAQRKAEERIRREREAAIERERYLDSLTGRKSGVWQEVESLLESTSTTHYAKAVHLLHDLRNLAECHDLSEFQRKMRSFRLAHAKRAAFIRRLDRTGL